MRAFGAGCMVLAAVAAFAKPQVVKTVFPTRDVVIAEEILSASGAASADAAPAIQAAVDRVSKAG